MVKLSRPAILTVTAAFKGVRWERSWRDERGRCSVAYMHIGAKWRMLCANVYDLKDPAAVLPGALPAAYCGNYTRATMLRYPKALYVIRKSVLRGEEQWA